MSIASKKRIASEVLKAGTSRVRFDPDSYDLIEDAITKKRIRQLVKDGVIWAVPKKGVSRARWRLIAEKKMRGKGPGSKEGAKGARSGKKKVWMEKVRRLRNHLHILKERGEIPPQIAKKIRLAIKGGHIKSLKSLRETIQSIRGQGWK